MSAIRRALAAAALVAGFARVAWPAEPPALAIAPPAAEAGAPPAPEAAPTTASPEYVESNVISLVDRDGFRWRNSTGDFELKPYVLLQAYFQGKYVNNEWLDLADQDNVTELGFGASNALLGIAGRAFRPLTFNLTLNAACSGACLLNQAWMDVNAADALRFRIGKFKTPMHWSYQVRVGQAQLPRLPASLSAPVVLDFGLNSATPSIGFGFDTGAMVHGAVREWLEYQVGVFSGEGSGVNSPTSTMSDDYSVPGLLYAARVALTPLGRMPLQEGGPARPRDLRVLVGASGSFNVEANAESSDDLRAGLELAVAAGRFYWGAEAYALRMGFTERQRGTPARLFLGGYTQLGYAITPRIEPVVRLEAFDRNSTARDGLLIVPAVGVNYFIYEQNLRVQAMYQALLRTGYANDTEAHMDDNGLPDGTFVLQIQVAL